MIRKTLTIFSLVGLLVSVGLWVVGHFFTFGYMTKSYALAVENRSAVMAVHPQGSFSAYQQGWIWQKPIRTWFRIAMPEYFDHQSLGGPWGLKLPLWIPTLAFAIGSISFIVIPLCRKRTKLGLCLRCGYDLRTSKERCPECGQEFETT